MNIGTKIREYRNRRAIRQGSGNSRFYLWHLRNCYWPELASAEHFASEFSKSNQSVYFVRVGAEREVLNDTIHRIIRRDRWRGIITEASPETFEQLVRPLYHNMDGIKTINAKVDSKEVIKLIEETGINQIDWFQTNTGDQNSEIIKALESLKIQIRVIVFEHSAMKPESIRDCSVLLSERGYRLKNFGKETLAAQEEDEYLLRFLSE